MSLERTRKAYMQAGLEGVGWLRDQEKFADNKKLGRLALQYLRHGHAKIATLTLVQGFARALPKLSYRQSVNRRFNPDIEVVGSGAESIAVKQGELVHKYLTGKSLSPSKLKPEVDKRHEAAAEIMANFFPPTSISLQKPELFQSSDLEYVTMTQPFIRVKYVDPHHDPALIESNPTLANQLRQLAGAGMCLFEETGLLLDFLNSGNVVWGRTETDTEDRLYFLDTLCAHQSDKDIVGLKAPFWNTDRYVENLVEFVVAVRPDYDFGDDQKIS